jgi:hypothetical protein
VGRLCHVTVASMGRRNVLSPKKADHNTKNDHFLEIMWESLNTVKTACDTLSGERRLWTATMQEMITEMRLTRACQVELNSTLEEIARLQVPRSDGAGIRSGETVQKTEQTNTDSESNAGAELVKDYTKAQIVVGKVADM